MKGIQFRRLRSGVLCARNLCHKLSLYESVSSQSLSVLYGVLLVSRVEGSAMVCDLCLNSNVYISTWIFLIEHRLNCILRSTNEH